jgi:hypothetical protein
MNAVPVLVLDRPSPEIVEKLAREYEELEKDYDEAKAKLKVISDKLDEKADYLRGVVRDFGSAHAKKSKILHGLTHEIMVTYSSSVSIDDVAVENFRVALQKAKKVRLLKAIFEKTIRWTMQPQASEVIRGSKLTDRLLGLAMKCEVITPKTPSVTVRAKSS